METILTQYVITIGWAITGAISMALSLAILITIFSKLTPINEWEEIEKGNMAVAIIMASVLIGGAIVIAVTVLP